MLELNIINRARINLEEIAYYETNCVRSSGIPTPFRL